MPRLGVGRVGSVLVASMAAVWRVARQPATSNHLLKGIPMVGLDELRRMVRNYPGGRPVIAQRLGKSDETLRKELEGAQGFKLSVLVALEIQAYCVEVGSNLAHEFAHVVAREAGGQFVPNASVTTGRLGVTESLSHQTKEVAEMVLAVLSSINSDDGGAGISNNKLRKIQSESMEAVQAINNLVMACERLNQAVKPVHIREAQRPH